MGHHHLLFTLLVGAAVTVLACLRHGPGVGAGVGAAVFAATMMGRRSVLLACNAACIIYTLFVLYDAFGPLPTADWRQRRMLLLD